jgi:hypothetical protein
LGCWGAVGQDEKIFGDSNPRLRVRRVLYAEARFTAPLRNEERHSCRRATFAPSQPHSCSKNADLLVSFSYLSLLVILRISKLLYLYAMNPQDISAGVDFSLRLHDVLSPGDMQDFSLDLAPSYKTSMGACYEFFQLSFGMSIFKPHSKLDQNQRPRFPPSGTAIANLGCQQYSRRLSSERHIVPLSLRICLVFTGFSPFGQLPSGPLAMTTSLSLAHLTCPSHPHPTRMPPLITH